MVKVRTDSNIYTNETIHTTLPWLRRLRELTPRPPTKPESQPPTPSCLGKEEQKMGLAILVAHQGKEKELFVHILNNKGDGKRYQI